MVEKSVKRRGKRVGPKHRMWITMAQPSIEALRAQSEKLGYSVSALAQLVIDRGVVAGLLYADTPSPQGAAVVSVTLMEKYVQLSEKLRRSDAERIEGLIEHLDLKEQRIAQMQRVLEEYAETITQQAREIQSYEHGVIEEDARQSLEAI